MEKRLRELCTLLGEDSAVMADSVLDIPDPKDSTSDINDSSYDSPVMIGNLSD